MTSVSCPVRWLNATVPVGVRARFARVPAAQRQLLDFGAGELSVLPARSAAQLTCGDEGGDGAHRDAEDRRGC